MADERIQDWVIDGVRCRVREVGAEGADEAVVLVHGNPGSSEDFAALMADVAYVGRAIAPDMPGFGKSDRPADFAYTVEGYAATLGALLDALGVKRAHLVLHDFGGPWGLCWAASHPERVASLVLFNMGALPGYRWHKYARVWRTPIVGELLQLFTNRTLFRLLLNAENPRPFPRAFLDRMYDDADWAMRMAVLKLYRATDSLDASTTHFAEKLRDRRLPALVLWGDEDPYLPVRFSEAQHNYFDAVVHRIPRAGHWPMVDEPGLVAELVVPFLASHWGRTDRGS